jgi:hypothetical protein
MTRTRARGRWASRLGLAAASTIVLTAGLAAAASPAGAQITPTNPYAPAYQHSYRHGAVPTRETLTKMRAYSAAHPSAIPADSSANLRYGGGVDGIGVTTGHEKVYLVFWGTQWGTQSTNGSGDLTFSTDTAGGAPKLQEMYKGLGTGGELWSGVMTQYCEGVPAGTQICGGSGTHVAYPTGGALSGVWYDNATAEPTAASALQLGNEAVRAASHFANTSASLNRSAQYVILSPKGLNPDHYQTGGFCAWHDWNGDVGASSSVGDIAFTNMPYVMDQGASCGQNFVNGGSAGTVDGYTMVDGHEYSETITDQNPAGGYTDTSGEENADKCAWISPGTHGGAGNVSMGTGSFAEQGTWSNDSVSGTGDCEISHAIVGGGGGGSPTVTNPGTQTSTVGTPVSLTMSASGGTPPYTWSATGLPAGLSINTTSGVISGTPTTAATSSVTVTVHDSASATGTTTFSWVVNPTGGGCPSPGQKLGNPGFETGSAAPWSATPAVIDNSAAEPAHSGSWKAWLDGYGTTHTDTLSQSVTLPSGCSSYSLTFYLHIDTAETTTTTQYDKLTVKMGSTTLVTYSNLNKASGYQLRTLNVAAFAGSTVTLTFTGTEDSSLQTSFVIDDTALTVS